MTNPDRIASSDDLTGWYDYGNSVTLLVRHDVAGTPMVKLMDVDQFSTLVSDLGSLPQVLAIGNDGKPHQGRHRIIESTIAFHFPTGSQNDFAIDLPPTFTTERAEPQPEGTP